MVDFKLNSKVVIVTDGETCLGNAIGDLLLRRGFNVVFVARNAKKMDLFEELHVEFREHMLVLQWNLMDCSDIAEATLQHFGAIHALVCCSRELAKLNTESATETDLREVWRTQVTDPCQLLQTILPQLKINKGSVVFLSTSSSRTPNDLLSNMASADKDILAKTIAQELVRYDISVNTMNIFGCEPRTSQSTLDWIWSVVYGAPLKRGARINEVAESVAFLICDEMKHMTGHVMRIDGGLSITSPAGFSVLLATLAYLNRVILTWWNKLLELLHIN